MPSRSTLRWITHLALAAAGVLVVAFHATGQTQPPAPGDDPRFTGLSTVVDSKDLSIARRRFEPGARSAWHSHDNGQLLYVEQGRLRTQKKGQPVQELGVGASDYTGPNVVHWHGAVPATHLIQVNVGFGGETRWMQKVTDAEYAAK
jgi:quercetin dioxygenase-like cupin family protein